MYDSEQEANQRRKKQRHPILDFIKFWECAYCRHHYFIKPRRCRKCYHYSFEFVRTHNKDSLGISRMYCRELTIDLLECKEIKVSDFFIELCELIEVERGIIHKWVSGDNSQSGVCATSEGHILLVVKDEKVYLNIVSRKEFDRHIVRKFVETYFYTTHSYSTLLERR